MNIRSTLSHTASVLPLAVALLTGACKKQLLDVETPDIITPEVANSIAGAQAYRTAAIGNFARFIGGDQGGGSPLGLNLTGGMLADEIFSARAGTEHMDNRTINPNTFPIDSWTQVGNSFTRLVSAINLVTKYPPASGLNDQLAELHAQEGFLYTITAENYCSGVPFWDGVESANVKTVTLTTAQLYTRALFQFDSALQLTGTPPSATRNLALVGKARTLVDQGGAANYAAAALITPEVPTSFVYNAQFSKLTTGIVNAIYDWMLSTKNFGASDKEGGTGLDYVSAKDPRVMIDGTKTGAGQDGTITPLANQYPATDSPVPVATGIEARLIEAEAQLAANNFAGFIATLNTLRASAHTYGTVTTPVMTPLVDPGTKTGREDMLFRERAFWMYMTAHRLGDMRRLIRQYGRGAETVFPTGNYFKGGKYGTDVTLVPSQTETNNPLWTACADKNP